MKKTRKFTAILGGALALLGSAAAIGIALVRRRTRDELYMEADLMLDDLCENEKNMSEGGITDSAKQSFVDQIHQLDDQDEAEEGRLSRLADTIPSQKAPGLNADATAHISSESDTALGDAEMNP